MKPLTDWQFHSLTQLVRHHGLEEVLQCLRIIAEQRHYQALRAYDGVEAETWKKAQLALQACRAQIAKPQ